MQWSYFLLIALYCYTIHCDTFNYSFPCSSSQRFDASTLKCEICQQPYQPDPNSVIATSCTCKIGYKTKINNTCQTYTNSSQILLANQYYSVYNRDGSSTVNPSISNCSNNSYPNSNRTGCIPCPINMQYFSSSQSCECNTSGLTKTPHGCFDLSILEVLGLSLPSNSEITYLIFSCYHFSDILSCSHLLNLCIYKLNNINEIECNFFYKSNLTYYLIPNETNEYKLSGSQFNKNSILELKLITYLKTGNYLKQQKFELNNLIKCGLLHQNQMKISIGSNININCQYNFNYLLQKFISKQYSSNFYQLFVKSTHSQQYFQVKIYFNDDQSSIPVKRYFIQNSFSENNYINVMTSFSLTFTLNTFGELISPALYPKYTRLQLEDGIGITPLSSQVQSLSYSVSFNFSLDTFWSVIIPIFISLQIFIIIIALGKTYIGYLNRQSYLLFFLNCINSWSIVTFYFLLIVTGYWFVFTKTTEQIYIFMPKNSNFYSIFYALVALMGFCRIVSVIIEKLDKLNTQVFMINWQKGIFRNSWRQIFIVNSLAQLYTHRTISIFWMLIIHLFFMVGLQWQKHSKQTVTTELTNISNLNPKNRLLLYFLSCSILLIIGIIFKILRRLSILCWHYPFENFVDYCNVTNISFYFIRKKYSQSFYLHASIPDRTEVSYKKINQTIRHGLQKNRNIQNHIAFPDNLKLYTIFMSSQLETKFNYMLRREQQQQNNNQMRYTKISGKKLKNIDYRQDFIQRKLKQDLENIVQQNHQRTKSLLQSLFGIPPLDLRNDTIRGSNFILFDQMVQLTSWVFPNGNQFQEIQTTIIIFLVFIIITNNTTIAALITYFIDQYIINSWIAYLCRKKLEKMTKVKQGFMV